MNASKDDAKLEVSRHAGRLFLKHGVAGTSGDDIAEAAGLSKRTVWRYFRNKESCVEPLFQAASLRFIAMLRQWPRNVSIEAHLRHCVAREVGDPQHAADGLLAVQLVAMLPEEPALRSAWLMAAQAGEEALAGVIADRLRRSGDEAEVRLCAATVMAAIRVVDETVSFAAIKQGRQFSLQEAIDQQARAIRAACTLPICDPLADGEALAPTASPPCA